MRFALRVMVYALMVLISVAISTGQAQVGFFRDGSDPQGHPTDRLDPNDPPVIVALPAANVAAMVRFQELLDAPAPFTDVDLPLSKFVVELQSKSGLPCRIDTKGLEEVGIVATCRLKARLSHVSLRALLNILLKPHDLVWRVMDESLVITTPEKSSARLETRVYLVGDIVKTKFTDGSYNDEFDELIEVITGNLESSSWDEVGGPGSIREFRMTHSLVVNQTASVHDRIALLLNAIRRTKAFILKKPDRESKTLLQSSASLLGKEKWRPVLFAPSTVNGKASGSYPISRIQFEKEVAARHRLFKLLDLPMDCEFRAVLLSDVVKSLAEKTGVNWRLDERKLEEAGVAPDTIVDFSTPKISLRSLLNQMLGKYDLTYMIKDESFVVTTPEDMGGNQELQVYYVGDLVSIYDGENKYFDYDSLIELITSNISPTTWGEGNSNGLRELGYAEALSFEQSQEVHEQVELLLAALRIAKAYYAKPAPQPAPAALAPTPPAKAVVPKPPVRPQTPTKAAPRPR